MMVQREKKSDKVTRLECSDCGGVLDVVDKAHAICPHCGQRYIIDSAGNVSIEVKIAYGDQEKTKKAINKAMVALICTFVVAFILFCVLFVYNSDALRSVFSFSDSDIKSASRPIKEFCSDIFDKDYHEITKEELETIKYIRYSNVRYGNTNDWFHVIEYSFTDYKDCESEDEFEATVHRWTLADNNSFTQETNLKMFTGLTRVSLEWEVYDQKFSKDAPITYVYAPNKDLKTVNKLINPENVEVLVVDAGDDLSEFKKYPNLKKLVLAYGIFADTPDINDILTCTTLEELQIMGASEYENIEKLAELPKLKSLYMDGLCLEDCSFLSEISTLEELWISAGEEPDLSLLATMPNLKSFYMIGYYYGEVDSTQMEYIKSLENLENLKISIEDRDVFREIANIKSLKTLELTYHVPSLPVAEREKAHVEELTPVELELFANCPNLEELKLDFDVYTEDVPVQGIEVLLNSPNMKSIVLNEQYMRPSAPITSDATIVSVDPTLLTDNDSIKKLQLVNGLVVDETTGEPLDFSFLKHYPQMELLVLDYCRVKEVSFVEGLPNLRYCSMAGNEVADFSPFAQSARLEMLATYDNSVPVSGLTKDIPLMEDYTGAPNLTEYLGEDAEILEILK